MQEEAEKKRRAQKQAELRANFAQLESQKRSLLEELKDTPPVADAAASAPSEPPAPSAAPPLAVLTTDDVSRVLDTGASDDDVVRDIDDVLGLPVNSMMTGSDPWSVDTLLGLPPAPAPAPAPAPPVAPPVPTPQASQPPIAVK